MDKNQIETKSLLFISNLKTISDNKSLVSFSFGFNNAKYNHVSRICIDYYYRLEPIAVIQWQTFTHYSISIAFKWVFSFYLVSDLTTHLVAAAQA